jgi:arylformamidase
VARPDDKARPVLVYIHGGYWQELSKDEHSFPAAALHRHGISYIAVGYGLAPAASMKEMVDRCRRAIAWIVTHCAQLAIDPTQIHVAGSSAGAHLAAMAGLADWQLFGLSRNPIRSLTLLSGVFDLRPLLRTYINDAVRMNEEDALLNSPQLRIDVCGEFPPSLVVYGDNETAEFKRQSDEFAASLIRKGHRATLREIGGRNHFDLPFDIAEETTLLGKLMLDHCLRLS